MKNFSNNICNAPATDLTSAITGLDLIGAKRPEGEAITGLDLIGARRPEMSLGEAITGLDLIGA
ncbi:MAG: hypothetical protein ACK4NS_03300 [Saprospiraceae bacterium]